MERQTPNPDQPKIVLIYSALTVGFVFLLTLIWLIGSRSVDRLQAISNIAYDISKDYQKRLSTAARISEEEVNVIAQAKSVYATRDLKISIPPFRISLNESMVNFSKALEEARDLWGPRAEQQNLKPAELEAWREVEDAAPKFLTSIRALTSDKDGKPVPEPQAVENNAPGSDPQPVEPQTGSPDSQFDHEPFREARERLDKAVDKLSQAIIEDQAVILTHIANQQRSAAAEVSQARWGAFMVGVFVAVTVFIITRSQIAQLRRAIRSAQDAQDFARSVFDSQSNDILVITESGDLLAVNQAFFRHFHLASSELILQDYKAAFAQMPEIAAFIGNSLQQAEKNTTHRQRLEVKTKRMGRQSQGFAPESRLFDVYVSPLTIGQETRGRVVVLVDVTEEERVREELRRNRTLSAVGQITAQVAHELYNPIGAVKLNIELMEMQLSEADDDLKHTVARLKRGVEHLSTIVMDLRYLTRPRDPERKLTNLNKLLDEVVELASDRLDRARTEVVREYATDLQPGNFDPQQLRKVFLNLLINAVEASPVNSKVELKTDFIPPQQAAEILDGDGNRGALAISVIDHGSGMSEETKSRIFEAFYTTKRNGTGLGMMITQEIIKKHGGAIEIESEEGTGTKVSVYLPVQA